MPKRRRNRRGGQTTKRAAKAAALQKPLTARRIIKANVKKYGPALATLAGGALTKALHQYISGFGDYKLNSNTLFNGLDPPEVRNGASGHNSIIVSHREFLGDINSSTAFTLHEYTINPGDEITFPWLHQIATSFEEYKLRGLLFYFNSMSSPNVLAASATTSLGTVIMATQYDVEDPSFINKMEMENYCYANSRVPYQSFIHPVECARSTATLNELYIRDGSPNPGTDSRFYDFGRFVLATVGMQGDTGVIGELWVTYEIELIKPKLKTVTSHTSVMDHYYSADPTGASPFGTAPEKRPGSNMHTSIVDRHILFYDFHAGAKIMVTYMVTGNSTAITQPTWTDTGFSVLNIFADGTTNLRQNGGTTTTLICVQTFVADSSGSLVLIIGNGGTIPASGVMDLVIELLPDDVTSTPKHLPIIDWEDTTNEEHLARAVNRILSKCDTWHREDICSEPILPITNFNRKISNKTKSRVS